MEVLPQLWKSDCSVLEVLPPDNGSFSASSGAAVVNSGSLPVWLVEKWKFYSESRGFMEVRGCVGYPFPAAVLALSWLLIVCIAFELWSILL